jgi:hypothetical protein
MRELSSTYEMIHKRVVESSLVTFIYFVLALVIGFVHMGYSGHICAIPLFDLIMMTIELFFLSLGIRHLLTMITALIT